MLHDWGWTALGFVFGVVGGVLVLLVGAVEQFVVRWRARRRARIAQDHSASSFLFRLPRCECDACRAWRRTWGGR